MNGSTTKNSPPGYSSASCTTLSWPSSESVLDVASRHRPAALPALSSSPINLNAPASCASSGSGRRRIRSAGPGACASREIPRGGAWVARMRRERDRCGDVSRGRRSVGVGSSGVLVSLQRQERHGAPPRTSITWGGEWGRLGGMTHGWCASMLAKGSMGRRGRNTSFIVGEEKSWLAGSTLLGWQKVRAKI